MLVSGRVIFKFSSHPFLTGASSNVGAIFCGETAEALSGHPVSIRKWKDDRCTVAHNNDDNNGGCVGCFTVLEFLNSGEKPQFWYVMLNMCQVSAHILYLKIFNTTTTGYGII